MNVIPYLNLKENALKEITKLKLNFINAQLDKKAIEFKYDESLLDFIVALSNARDTGARNIELIINSKVMPQLSKVLLNAAVEKKTLLVFSVIDSAKNTDIDSSSQRASLTAPKTKNPIAA
ncbi:MAG: hypothetical protein P8015_12145 [Acidihalobacter sp.]